MNNLEKTFSGDVKPIERPQAEVEAEQAQDFRAFKRMEELLKGRVKLQGLKDIEYELVTELKKPKEERNIFFVEESLVLLQGWHQAFSDIAGSLGRSIEIYKNKKDSQ